MQYLVFHLMLFIGLGKVTPEIIGILLFKRKI